ncbi:MAG: response regulator transcription factor [Bacteroidetes bacterium]|nr:response regulator transcription factor [Bacteroidota bacterium]
MRPNTLSENIPSPVQVKNTVLQENVRVLIVDDHQMIRDGIRTMLESKTDTCRFIISEAESGEDAIVKVQKNDYDIILMDYQLPGINGAATVYNLLLYKPHLKILALSNYDEYSYIRKIVDSGAKGYILKDIGPTELYTAIATILSGKPYYSNDVALKLIHHKTADAKLRYRGVSLSKREIQVLKGIANEKSNEEIAKKLNIAKRTVDSHRQNLINKLGVKNTVGLVKLALELKLI